MIPAYLPQRRPAVLITFLVGLTVVVELASSYGTESFASNLLCDLALIATFVAASERRHKAMLAAIGLACGLTTYGAMLLPLAIGLLVSRRVTPRTLLLIPLFACLAIIALNAPTSAPGTIGLWSVAPRPEVTGLLAAFALGSLGWLTAMLSARPLMPDMLPAAAATCALGYALVMPGGSMAIALALAFRCEDRRISLLAGLATVMAAFALPIPATLALAIAVALATRPFFASAANDNSTFAPQPQVITPA